MTSDSATERSELWVWCAFALVLAAVGGLIYLGSHPDGLGPIRVYLSGPPVLALSALAVGLWGLVQSLLCRPFLRRGRMAGWFAVGATIALASYPLPFPSRHTGRPSPVRLELPVEGAWRVRWGGVDPEHNLPASVRPDRRFGYDLVALEGAPVEAVVHAPCDGRVVAVRDHERAHPDELAAGLGTHVVLAIAAGQYLVLASLARDSVTVAVGHEVRRGEALARVGDTSASVFTGGAHLILFVQDTPDPLWAQGIPLEFGELMVNGERVERAQPRGQSVREPARRPGDVVERVR